ncbi:MAG: CD225/dispanin family protein [Brevundimonas sp.]
MPPGPATRKYPAPIGWVIAAIILFWPTAIPALLASHRSARAAGAGDVALAEHEAATAKRWGAISVIVGALLVVASVLASIAWAVLLVVWHHDDVHTRAVFRIDGPSNVQPFRGGDGWGSQERQLPQAPRQDRQQPQPQQTPQQTP